MNEKKEKRFNKRVALYTALGVGVVALIGTALFTAFALWRSDSLADRYGLGGGSRAWYEAGVVPMSFVQVGQGEEEGKGGPPPPRNATIAIRPSANPVPPRTAAPRASGAPRPTASAMPTRRPTETALPTAKPTPVPVIAAATPTPRVAPRQTPRPAVAVASAARSAVVPARSTVASVRATARPLGSAQRSISNTSVRRTVTQGNSTGSGVRGVRPTPTPPPGSPPVTTTPPKPTTPSPSPTPPPVSGVYSYEFKNTGEKALRLSVNNGRANFPLVRYKKAKDSDQYDVVSYTQNGFFPVVLQPNTMVRMTMEITDREFATLKKQAENAGMEEGTDFRDISGELPEKETVIETITLKGGTTYGLTGGGTTRMVRYTDPMVKYDAVYYADEAGTSITTYRHDTRGTIRVSAGGKTRVQTQSDVDISYPRKLEGDAVYVAAQPEGRDSPIYVHPLRSGASYKVSVPTLDKLSIVIPQVADKSGVYDAVYYKDVPQRIGLTQQLYALNVKSGIRVYNSSVDYTAVDVTSPMSLYYPHEWVGRKINITESETALKRWRVTQEDIAEGRVLVFKTLEDAGSGKSLNHSLEANKKGTDSGYDTTAYVYYSATQGVDNKGRLKPTNPPLHAEDITIPIKLRGVTAANAAFGTPMRYTYTVIRPRKVMEIYYPADWEWEGTWSLAPVLDEEGNPLLDEEGNPVSPEAVWTPKVPGSTADGKMFQSIDADAWAVMWETELKHLMSTTS